MASKKIKPHKKQSIIKQTLSKRKSQQDLKEDEYFTISFRHLDREQGDNLVTWENSNILAHSIDVLAGYCNGKMFSQVDGKKFTIYGDFPPKEKTNFVFPKQVPEDAKWARIHITGLQCIIGHIVQNVFFVVFLDSNHQFWESSLKNT